MSAKTITSTHEYNNKPIFAIWLTNKAGEKSGNYPVISFGPLKAKLILEHIEAIRQYVETHETEALKNEI